MKKLFAFKASPIFIILLILSNNIYSQKDWSAKLNKVLITEKDGKYSIEDFMLIETDGKSLQIKMSATAPTNVIGRDNFVSFYAIHGTMIILSMVEKSGKSISDIDIKTLDEVIGEPDITITFVVAKNGFQLQLTSAKGTKKTTRTWDEVFNDE